MLAYVAYLNLSVFTKRQIVNSKNAMKQYESEEFSEDRTDSMISTLSQRAMGAKVNLIYFVFKLKWFWFIFDFIAR